MHLVSAQLWPEGIETFISMNYDGLQTEYKPNFDRCWDYNKAIGVIQGKAVNDMDTLRKILWSHSRIM